jgi:hypothetical protein
MRWTARKDWHLIQERTMDELYGISVREREQFEEICAVMMWWLRKHGQPNMMVVVTPQSAELAQSLRVVIPQETDPH